MYNEYFDKLIEKFKEQKSMFPNEIRLTHRDSRGYVSFQYKKFIYEFVISAKNSSVFQNKGFVVGLYINDKNHFESFFNQLKKYKNEIEKNLNVENLIWQSKEQTDSQNVCRIFTIKKGDVTDKTNWDKYLDWHLNTMSKFLRILPKYTKNLSNNENIKTTKEKTQMQTKNIILYGPPGVGKTHNHKKLIALIEGEDFSEIDIFKFITENKDDEILEGSVDELFNKVKSENRFKFVTFHQSYSYEDFIEGFRPQEDGNIELVDGIFKEISKEASENLVNSQKEKKFDFETFLNDFIQDVEQKEIYEIDDNLTISVKKKSNGEFQSFHVGGRVQKQSLTKDVIKRDFEPFLEGKIKSFRDIKPSFQSQSRYHGNAPYYFRLYQQMKKFLDDSGNNYSSQKEPQKNFYILIDEINRGNISKIFGELITLIEDDKRDKIEVTLPYSKEPFKVPSNLYIIATMNSTDKSIALIDVALRRRFTFLKMKPDIKLVHKDVKKLFEELNKFITEKLDEDYQIGHSYFMGDDFDKHFVLEYKIKPLLEEYFYHDKNSLDECLNILNPDGVPDRIRT